MAMTSGGGRKKINRWYSFHFVLSSLNIQKHCFLYSQILNGLFAEENLRFYVKKKNQNWKNELYSGEHCMIDLPLNDRYPISYNPRL